MHNHSNGNGNDNSGSRNKHSNERNDRCNGRGRPTKRTKTIGEAILASIEKGLPFSLACSRAGVSHEFFVQWRQDDPEFESLVALACSLSVEHNLEVVQRAAANGDWKAAAWMLERSHPKMFSRPEVQVKFNQQLNVKDRVDGYQTRKPSSKRAMRLRTLSVSKRQDDNKKKPTKHSKDPPAMKAAISPLNRQRESLQWNLSELRRVADRFRKGRGSSLISLDTLATAGGISDTDGGAGPRPIASPDESEVAAPGGRQFVRR